MLSICSTTKLHSQIQGQLLNTAGEVCYPYTKKQHRVGYSTQGSEMYELSYVKFEKNSNVSERDHIFAFALFSLKRYY